MGRREPEHAKSYVGNAISMLAILGVILCVAVQLFLRPMMLLFGATPDVIDYGSEPRGFSEGFIEGISFQMR